MGKRVKVSVGKRRVVERWWGGDAAGEQACLWFVRLQETTRWSGDARDDKLPPSFLDNKEGRRGKGWLETFCSLLPFCFAHWCSSAAAAAACLCSFPRLSLPLRVCVYASSEGVVLRPWCSALSFRQRSHRQPPQEALAPPPCNDNPPPHPPTPAPCCPLLPPSLLLHPLPFSVLWSHSAGKSYRAVWEVENERTEKDNTAGIRANSHLAQKMKADMFNFGQPMSFLIVSFQN